MVSSPAVRPVISLTACCGLHYRLMGDDIEYSYDQLIYKPPGTSVELLFHQD